MKIPIISHLFKFKCAQQTSPLLQDYVLWLFNCLALKKVVYQCKTNSHISILYSPSYLFSNCEFKVQIFTLVSRCCQI